MSKQETQVGGTTSAAGEVAEGFGVMHTRDARSMFGPGADWLLDGRGERRTFPTLGEARAEAERLNFLLRGGAYTYAPVRLA